MGVFESGVYLGSLWGEVPQIRYRKLLGDEKTRSVWLDYAKELYEAVSGYENFYGGFLAWEDFWNYMEDAPGLFDSDRAGIDEARRIGFQQYLEEHYTLEQVNEYFSPGRPMTALGRWAFLRETVRHTSCF